MHRLEWKPLPVDQAGDVHQATTVRCHQVLGSSFCGGAYFVLPHGYGNLRKFHRKRTAKTAAELVIAHLHEFNALHFA